MKGLFNLFNREATRFWSDLSLDPGAILSTGGKLYLGIGGPETVVSILSNIKRGYSFNVKSNGKIRLVGNKYLGKGLILKNMKYEGGCLIFGTDYFVSPNLDSKKFLYEKIREKIREKCLPANPNLKVTLEYVIEKRKKKKRVTRERYRKEMGLLKKK